MILYNIFRWFYITFLDDIIYRDYYMSVFISYPVSTGDSHISPRLPYQPDGPRADTGVDLFVCLFVFNDAPTLMGH